MKQARLRNKSIGDGNRTYVIAEMAWSHDGSVEKAKKIMKGAGEAGADAISVHITHLEDYMVRNYGKTKGHTLSVGKRQEDVYDYLERINIKDDAWWGLFEYAKSLNLDICAMPNDMKSLKLCESHDIDCYVIAAACFIEENLIREIGRQKKPVILRIGGATPAEIEKAIDLLKKQGTEDIILLHGIQLYPTGIEGAHLRLIPSLKELFGLPVGLADHTDAESNLAMMVPLVSLAFGANVIEKHITHDRKNRGEDYISALNPDEFKILVDNIREIEKSFGSSSFELLTAGEQRYRQVSRKRIVASQLIKKGDLITQSSIAFKRADEGIYPDESQLIIGRTAGVDIEEDEPITWNLIA